MWKKKIELMIAAGLVFLGTTSGTVVAQEVVPADKVIAEAAKVVPAGLPQLVNRIEIKIGNEIITTTDIEMPLQQLEAYLKKELRGDALKEKMATAREQHLQKLIEAKLLLLEARHQKIEIQDAMVKENAEKEVEQLKGQFPSESAFKKQLDAEHLNEVELLHQREKMVRENLMRQKLLQQKLREFKTGADISDDKLRAYYKEHQNEFHSPARANVQQIFVERPSTSLAKDEFAKKDLQAQTRIGEALQKLKQGQPFDAVARVYSEHKLSADRGGEIGWVEEGDLGLPELEKAIFTNLDIGQNSKVLDTARGYFIIKLVDRQPGQTMAFEEVRGRIRQNFMAEGSEERYNLWIDSLKEKYQVNFTADKK